MIIDVKIPVRLYMVENLRKFGHVAKIKVSSHISLTPNPRPAMSDIEPLG